MGEAGWAGARSGSGDAGHVGRGLGHVGMGELQEEAGFQVGAIRIIPEVAVFAGILVEIIDLAVIAIEVDRYLVAGIDTGFEVNGGGGMAIFDEGKGIGGRSGSGEEGEEGLAGHGNGNIDTGEVEESGREVDEVDQIFCPARG